MGESERLNRWWAERAERLAAGTSCFRWVDGELDGVTVDLFDDVAVLSLYRTLGPAEELALAQALSAARPLRAVYLKRRPREARRRATEAAEVVAPPLPLLGAPVERLEGLELGSKFEIRPGNGLSVGLYLDSREARAVVRRHAGGRRVLNAFSYTCGFGVVASLGGASRVANLDLSRKVLDWGELNYRLNRLPADRFDFIKGDVFEWLGRLAKKDERFDLVVLDPPGFSTVRGRPFTAQRDYHRLVALARGVLAPGGLLLALCNVEALSEAELLAQVELGLAGARWRVVEPVGPSPIDFRQRPPGLKGALIEVR